MATFLDDINQAESEPSQHQERVDVYDSISQAHLQIVAELLDTFHKACRTCDDEDQQFLDIGCGPGRVTLECLFPRCQPCRRLVAVDNSAAMLKFAAENYPHPKICYLPLDIAECVDGFLHQQGQFQRVYSFLTLHWIRNQRRCFSNIEKLMAPEGECLLLFKQSVHFFNLFEAMMSTQRWSKYSQVFESMMPATATLNGVAALRAYARDLLNSTSLTALACEVFVSAMPLQWTRERLTESLLSFNPVYPRLEKGEKEDLKNFIEHFVKNLSIDTFNRNPANRTYIVIHASKPA